MKLKFLFLCVSLVLLLTSVGIAQQNGYQCPEGMVLKTTKGFSECVPAGNSSKTSGIADVMSGSGILGQINDVLTSSDNDSTKGKWIYDKKVSEDSCSATFIKNGVWVTIISPGAKIPGALLIFSSAEVPMPTELTKIRATLSQTNSKPQTVQVFNFTGVLDSKNNTKTGIVFFQVPTMDALLAGMEDVHNFEVTVNDKVVAKIEWFDGFAAREKLKQCLEKTKKQL